MGANISESIPHSVWWGWGDPARATPLSPEILTLLRERFHYNADAILSPPVALEDVVLGEGALDAESEELLRGIVGAPYISAARLDRVVHAGGKNTPDLLRRRGGDARDAPDAVVYPGSAAEVLAVLALCSERRIAVVPFGGGTSVVGGVEPLRDRFTHLITLDLSRLNRLLSVDPVSRTATFEAGIRGPAIEAALAAHNFTLGHLPQSHQEASLGGYAATRSAGQASTGYGSSDELITGLRVQTPRGELRLGGRAPASAAGPDLRELFLGSEGVLGVITEVTVRISPRVTAKSYGAWAFSSFEAGAEALRRLAQDAPAGDIPEVCRLSDAEETELNLAMSGSSSVRTLRRYLAARGLTHPALALFVWEGSDGRTRSRRRRISRLLRRAGGVWVTAGPAQAWDRGRFGAPYLRDELLGRGVFVETLETAALWSNLAATHAAVSGAIRAALVEGDAPCAIQGHISHLYPEGASLYFTFIAAAESDPFAQYARVKAAASEAIVAAGATISHHHAVGLEHAPYLEAEIGALGVRALAGVKAVLDPEGILNPRKLLG
ncbi:FAD-binding oxidoreductase [Mycetocola spongiae]|uniref:FAD-binding oxidoreductase n=1 Tax=Mycetocola spongiae TaxID=2859226 RepID=UPI001CF47E5D|nr:FAD-binding oxidoreductase [Mycetocola spongiae]UCR89853.1 FAD-binding oxidoreductase [Mycetocola spongiae]